MDHAAQAPTRATIPSHNEPAAGWQHKAVMASVNDLLKLFMRQAELERAMKRPGGARVIDERELNAVREKLAQVPDAVKARAAAGS